MHGAVIVVEFTAVSNAAAEEFATKLDAFLGVEPTPGGLLSYRVLRHREHHAKLLVVEEWTDHAMQDAFLARPEFRAFVTSITPLVAAGTNGDGYDVLSAGPTARP